MAEWTRRGFLGWAASSALLAGCLEEAGQSSNAVPSAAGPREIPLEFEGNPGGVLPGLHRFPKSSLRGYGFEGELRTKPIFLDGAYELSFVPAVNGVLAPGIFTVSAVTDGGVVDLMGANVAEGYGIVGTAYFVKADLSPFAGRRIALRWTFRPRSEGAPVTRGVVGMPRVFRKDARPERPHVILVCSDTHRYDYSLTAEGARLMPAFAQFCRDAVVFDRAYANASWTIPSTTSVMTGVNPFRHGAGWRVGVNADLIRRAGGTLPAERAKATEKRNYDIVKHDAGLHTFQERLTGEGYCSVCLAGNAWLRFCETAEDGFDLTTKELSIGSAPDKGAMLMKNARAILENWPRQQPLLLYVHSNHVHDYAREAPLLEAREGKRPFPTPAEWQATYGGRVREYDGHFNTLVSALRGAGIFDDAAVLFYADHGEDLLECGDQWGHGNGLSEAQLHVPVVIKPPSGAGWAAGRRQTRVQLLDLAPTILDMALGGDALQEFDGQFEGRALTDVVSQERNWPRGPIVSGVQFKGDELGGVRDGEWKYVYNFETKERVLSRGEDSESCDPADASEAEPEVAERMHGLLMAEWTRFTQATLGEGRSSLEELTPEQRQDLESMGYL